MSKPRLDDIDRAKGLAILLVVAGHVVARTPPAGNEWYVVLKETIYQFHMPLFMFLCGLVMGYGRIIPRDWADYRSFVGKKFLRLFPAYALFGVLILAGKIDAAMLLHVDNPPDGFFSGLATILLNPTSSAAASLWFIYTLFIFYALMPLLLKFTGDRPIWLVPLAVVAAFGDWTSLFTIDRVAQFAAFVLLGIAAARHYAAYSAAVDRYGRAAAAVFLAGLAAFALAEPWWPELFASFWAPAVKLSLGLASIPAVHYWMRNTLWGHGRWLETLGQYVFPIYLMNTIAIGVVKGVMLRFMSWDGANFLLFCPALLASGVWLCIAFKRYVLSRLPTFDRIIQ